MTAGRSSVLSAMGSAHWEGGRRSRDQTFSVAAHAVKEQDGELLPGSDMTQKYQISKRRLTFTHSIPESDPPPPSTLSLHPFFFAFCSNG